jgi:hypothetical protein
LDVVSDDDSASVQVSDRSANAPNPWMRIDQEAHMQVFARNVAAPDDAARSEVELFGTLFI